MHTINKIHPCVKQQVDDLTAAMLEVEEAIDMHDHKGICEEFCECDIYRNKLVDWKATVKDLLTVDEFNCATCNNHE